MTRSTKRPPRPGSLQHRPPSRRGRPASSGFYGWRHRGAGTKPSAHGGRAETQALTPALALPRPRAPARSASQGVWPPPGSPRPEGAAPASSRRHPRCGSAGEPSFSPADTETGRCRVRRAGGLASAEASLRGRRRSEWAQGGRRMTPWVSDHTAGAGVGSSAGVTGDEERVGPSSSRAQRRPPSSPVVTQGSRPPRRGGTGVARPAAGSCRPMGEAASGRSGRGAQVRDGAGAAPAAPSAFRGLRAEGRERGQSLFYYGRGNDE